MSSIHEGNLMMLMFVWFVFVMMDSFLVVARWFFFVTLLRFWFSLKLVN